MKFQVGINDTGTVQRAMNVGSVRDVFKGKVESLKGQVCTAFRFFVSCMLEVYQHINTICPDAPSILFTGK